MPTPVGGVTCSRNDTVHAPAPVQEAGTDGVMMIVGDATVITLTAVDTVETLPDASVTVAVTLYEPVASKVCDTTALPLTAPRSWLVPSPQFTRTFRIA